MSAEKNLTKAEDLKKVREVDFVTQFTHKSLAKLIEVLGVTRKVPMMEGTTMYVYTTKGELADGSVAEGEVIPLSQYKQEKKAVGEIALQKWRKAVSAEAIKKSGYTVAVQETDAEMLRDVQGAIRKSLIGFLNNGGGTAISGTKATSVCGKTLQEALARAWGELQVKFEDDAIEAVYFVNPLDIAEYLGTANISTQTVFGMSYVEDFLGLGTVITTSLVERGTFVATAKENFILYYLTMGGDIASAFGLTADETGYIGIKSGYQNEERAQIESLVMSGIQLMVEYAEGVVRGTISELYGEVFAPPADCPTGYGLKCGDIVGDDFGFTLIGKKAIAHGKVFDIDGKGKGGNEAWKKAWPSIAGGHFVPIQLPLWTAGKTLAVSGGLNSSASFKDINDTLLILRLDAIGEGNGAPIKYTIRAGGKLVVEFDFSDVIAKKSTSFNRNDT